MYSKISIIFAFMLVMVMAFTSCTKSNSSETGTLPTEQILTASDFEPVCLENAQARAATYNVEANEPQKILIMSQNSNKFDNELYGSKYDEFSEPKLPTRWIVKNGDYTQVAIVACIDKISDTFWGVCEYNDDKRSTIHRLNVYNAEYEIKIFAAQSGDNLTKEKPIQFNETVAECPIDYKFSEVEKDYYASPRDTSIQALVAPFVNPSVKKNSTPIPLHPYRNYFVNPGDN